MNPSATPKRRCPACGQLSAVLWVHGHGQCESCGTNIAPCCDGTAPPLVEISAAPRAILFDLDGTLIDSLADIAQAANYLRTRHNMTPLPAQTVAEYVGDGATELVRRVLQRPPPGVPGSEDLRAEVQIYRDYYSQHAVENTRLYPGIRQLVCDLHAEDRKLAVVTNKPHSIAEHILQSLQLREYFAAVIGGDSASEPKPSAAPIHLALARMGMPLREAWMIGDGAQDVLAAHAAGVVSCAVGWGFGDTAALDRAKPQRRAHDVSALARFLGVPFEPSPSF